MIVFDLKCSAGHVFEAWFDTSDDYESQRRRKLIACPLCGDERIDKALMAPNLPAKANSRADQRPVAASGDKSPDEVKAMLRAMADMQKQIEARADYVGEQFADEARAIHQGEADDRPIYGEASPDDAKALHEEGIEFHPLPFVPDDRN